MPQFEIRLEHYEPGCGCGCVENDLNIAEQHIQSTFHFSGTREEAEEELRLRESSACPSYGNYWSLQELKPDRLFTPEVVYQLLERLRDKEDKPVGLSKEMVDFLVGADAEEKKPFPVAISAVTKYPYRGPSETDTSETEYPERGFLLVEIPEAPRVVSAVSGHIDNEGIPGCRVYLFADRRMAFFIKKSEHVSVSPGIAQGEEDISDTTLTLAGILQF